MATIIVLVFVLGYIAIAFEGSIKLDKTVPALLMASIIWGLLALGFSQGWLDVINPDGKIFNFISGGESAMNGYEGILLHHLGKTSEILVFLIGAMTIVEIIDLHKGFDIIKRAIHTKSKRKLLWIIGILAFFLSAVIDNLTTTIVLITLLRKLVHTRKERIWYASIIVIAANAGGAWTPIGDVTTTMLWIGKKLTVAGLIDYVFLPSIVCFLVPTFIASRFKVFKGEVSESPESTEEEQRLLSSKTILWLGLAMIVSVPVFKALVNIPPYLGMMQALAVVWLVSSYIKPRKKMTQEDREAFSVRHALSKIDMDSILFFLGILMAVAGLEAMVYGAINGIGEVGTLRYTAEVLHNTIPNDDVVVILLGILSAIIDNVPLVAATMGMYTFPTDAVTWHFIAYSCGTGGSILIIGSAAGVAAMGMERIDFIWYLKKVAWLAFLGFIAGAGAFLFFERILFHHTLYY